MKKADFDKIIKDCPMIAPVFRLMNKDGQLSFDRFVKVGDEFYNDPRTGNMIHIPTHMSYKLGGGNFEFVEYRKVR